MKLIQELRTCTNLYGNCPRCGQEFRLRDAQLFLADKPPATMLVAMAAIKQGLLQRRQDIAQLRRKIAATSAVVAEAVNLGKILEKIVPSFASFGYRPRDCRSLFEPIDYLIFNGLTAKGKVESLTFLDIKTGKARLTERQRCIERAVNAGRVEFRILD